ncbi:MAG: carbon storage regulator [Pirellulaceae bacterium]|jgi:carbon storage regulator CsrA|nr:carbon storage regulator [Pirellulaceae bacterium]
MLVLTRKSQEQIRIGDDIVVTVLRVKGNSVRVGVEAPRQIRVVRGELPPKPAPFSELSATDKATDKATDEPARLPAAAEAACDEAGTGEPAASEGAETPERRPLTMREIVSAAVAHAAL